MSSANADLTSQELHDLMSQADRMMSHHPPKPAPPHSASPRRGLFSSNMSQLKKVSDNTSEMNAIESNTPPPSKPPQQKKTEPEKTEPKKQVAKPTPPAQSEAPQRQESETLQEPDKWIRIACKCGYRMRLKPHNAGKSVKCPKCKVSLLVPKSAATAESTAQLALKANYLAKIADERQKMATQQSTKPKQKLSYLAHRSLKSTFQGYLAGKVDSARARKTLEDLEATDDPRVFTILKQVWEEDRGNLQSQILRAMGTVGTNEALCFLLEKLQHPLPEVRLYAVQALGIARDPQVVRALMYFGQHEPDKLYAVSDSILKIGEPAIDPLIGLLGTTDRSLLNDAILILGRLKATSAVKQLLERLRFEQGSMRGAIAESLGLIGDPTSIPSLLPLLKDPEEKIRIQAAKGLARVPHPSSLGHLIQALKDPNAEVRNRCASALGELGDRKAAPALVSLLADDSREIRIAAAESLGRIGDERATPYLLEMLDETDESLVLKALTALKTIKNPDCAGALMPLLKHENARIRQRTVDVLGQVGDAVVAEQLERILKHDRSEDVRSAAAKSLGEIGDPGAIDMLLDALYDAFSVRCRAITALGELQEPTAIPALLALLKDPAPEIRYHAATALAEFEQEQAVKNIRPLLSDSNALVRRGAAKSLEKLGQGDAEKLLGSEAAQGLRRGSKGVKRFLIAISPGTLISTLTDSSPKLKAGIVAVLLLTPLAIGGYIFWPEGTTTESIAMQRRGDTVSFGFSPEGDRLIVGRSFGMVEVWDVASQTRTEAFVPKAGTSEISNVRFTSDPNQIVYSSGAFAGGFDLTAKADIWEAGGHSQQIVNLRLTPDRKIMCVQSAEGVVTFWKLPEGRLHGIGAIKAATSDMSAIAITPDGEMVASGGLRKVVTVWSTADGKELGSFRNFPEPIQSLAFNHDQTLIAASGKEFGNLTIWEIATGRVVFSATSDRYGAYSNLYFSQDGTQLISVFKGRQLAFLDLASKEFAYVDVKGPSSIARLIPNADGSVLAIADLEKAPFYLFDMQQQKIIGKLDYQ